MTSSIYKPRDGNNPFIKNLDEYKNLYEQSINNPSEFFSSLAKEDLSWMKDFTSVHNESLLIQNGLRVEKLILVLIALIGTLKITQTR
jgi:hypothetical protein